MWYRQTKPHSLKHFPEMRHDIAWIPYRQPFFWKITTPRASAEFGPEFHPAEHEPGAPDIIAFPGLLVAHITGLSWLNGI